MIRHQKEVTNHRIMWLLIGQGFLANAFVSAAREGASTNFMLPLAGIIVTLSAFLMLYKSYQARGYLLFLGKHAKQGTLQEEYLPLVGWPRKRIKGWWRGVWVCPWIGQPGDMLEPWLFLPCLFMFMWLSALLQQRTMLDTGVFMILAAMLSAVIFLCFASYWSGRRARMKGVLKSELGLRGLTAIGIWMNDVVLVRQKGRVAVFCVPRPARTM